MGRRYRGLMDSGPSPRIRNFGDPKPSRKELLAEQVEELRRLQAEWERELAAVAKRRGEDDDEAKEIAWDITGIRELIQKLEERLQPGRFEEEA